MKREYIYFLKIPDHFEKSFLFVFAFQGEFILCVDHFKPRHKQNVNGKLSTRTEKGFVENTCGSLVLIF